MNLGNSLKIALTKANISQSKLATDFCISRQTVSRWAKSGNMTKETIIDLAGYFNMKPSEFIALGE